MPSSGSIYGLRRVGSPYFRYVGLTRGTPGDRLRRHLNPRHNPNTPVTKWASSFPGEIEIVLLEEIDSDSPLSLEDAEQYWISQIKSFGHDLLNLSEGGASGSYGARWKLNPDKIRRGERHPFYGKKHTEKSNLANSAAHLGKPLVEHAKGLGSHVRWHVNRGISSDTCRHCNGN